MLSLLLLLLQYILLQYRFLFVLTAVRSARTEGQLSRGTLRKTSTFLDGGGAGTDAAPTPGLFLLVLPYRGNALATAL